MNSVWTWLGWLMVAALCAVAFWRALSRSDEPGRLAWRWVATVVIVAGMWWHAARLTGSGGGGFLAGFATAAFLAAGIAAGGILLGILWASTIGGWLARPLAGLYDDGGMEQRPVPCYSAAVAQRKQGRTHRAIQEVRRQLERFPDHFEGVLLLAEMQAVDLRDVPTAETTLLKWLADGRRDPGHRAIARTKLADWYLRISQDAMGARRCLEDIVKTAPDSEAAFLAEQRLAHLEFEARPAGGPLRITSGAGQPMDTGVPPPVAQVAPEEEATELERQLREHPHDLAARERLAVLRAWGFRRPDLARAELETLLDFPQVSEREAVHCLNLLADIEIQVAGDLEAARRALQRIVDRHPEVAAAEQARQRMRFLEREFNRHRGPQVIRGRSGD